MVPYVAEASLAGVYLQNGNVEKDTSDNGNPGENKSEKEILDVPTLENTFLDTGIWKRTWKMTFLNTGRIMSI